MKRQVQKSKYNLTTTARRKVVGRKNQLDEGAGRQIWKCLHPLNYVASAAFGKHGIWVQIWTWHFRGKVVPGQTLDLGLKRDRRA